MNISARARLRPIFMHPHLTRLALPLNYGIFMMLAGLAGTASAASILIDNFQQGPFSLSVDDSEGQLSDLQSGLDPANVISGQRNVVVQNQGGVVPTTAVLAIPNAGSGVSFTGDPDAIVSGFRLEYLLTSPIDLTLGGGLDRFRLEVSNPSGVSSLFFNVLVSNAVYAVGATTGDSGSFIFLYDDFFLAGTIGPGPVEPLDLTAVDELRIVGQIGGTFSIAAAEAIPEPSHLGLMATALIGVVFIRRRPASLQGLGCHGNACATP